MFNPLLKTKKSLYGEHCFASWFGTMASSRVPNSAVHRRRMKPGGCPVKPEVDTVSPAWGVFGGDRCARIETEQEQSNPGDSPRRWRRARAYIDITHALELEYTTLLISRSTVSLQDFFALQVQTDIVRISFFLFLVFGFIFLFSLYNSWAFEYFFLYLWILLLHWNLTLAFC
jgi:hypothetical protein